MATPQHEEVQALRKRVAWLHMSCVAAPQREQVQALRKMLHLRSSDLVHVCSVADDNHQSRTFTHRTNPGTNDARSLEENLRQEEDNQCFDSVTTVDASSSIDFDEPAKKHVARTSPNLNPLKSAHADTRTLLQTAGFSPKSADGAPTNEQIETRSLGKLNHEKSPDNTRITHSSVLLGTNLAPPQKDILSLKQLSEVVQRSLSAEKAEMRRRAKEAEAIRLNSEAARRAMEEKAFLDAQTDFENKVRAKAKELRMSQILQKEKVQQQLQLVRQKSDIQKEELRKAKEQFLLEAEARSLAKQQQEAEASAKAKQQRDQLNHQQKRQFKQDLDLYVLFIDEQKAIKSDKCKYIVFDCIAKFGKRSMCYASPYST